MKQRAFCARAKHRALVLTSGVLLACSTLSSLANAVERPVALGDVVAAEQHSAAAEQQLRKALEDGLDSVDFGRSPVRARFVLSATLVKLESVSENKTVRTTCVVSLALRRKHDSTLHAVINGRAIAEDAQSESDASREDALRGAVHSALSRLPEIVRSGDR
ncbi:MAG TPA: hypothetical protein VGI10_21855 [Polyangiaceae bacterium]|jgi:hypothetical protein